MISNRRGKLRDCALLLGVSGVILMLPYFLNVLKGVAALNDWPFVVLYLFVIWAALIFVARILAPGLRDLAYPDTATGTSDTQEDQTQARS